MAPPLSGAPVAAKGCRAAVIGSGFGGLALAIRLQAAGIATTIFERRDQPGGRAYVYREQGFTFDAGPTLITAPECLHELFHLAGKKTEDYCQLVPLSPFYRLLWDDGSFFDYSDDPVATAEQIRQRSPRDVEGFSRFMAYSRQTFEAGYVNLVSAAFPNVWSMLRVAPSLIRLQAFRSVYAMVSKYVRDPQLRQAFSFHPLLIGGNPYRASSLYTLINFLERSMGVWFAMGGTGALVQALAKLFTDLGGTLHLDAEITRITTVQGKVTGVETAARGEERFDLVASNADVLHTYQDLLADAPAARTQARRLRKMDYSMSLFLIYFGTNRQYPNLRHHSILFGPRYQGLLDNIFHDGILADDFSLYLHAPCRTDPSLAPPGCESFYVLSPVPHLGKSAGRIDWQKEAPIYADKILEYLERKVMPGLRASIVVKRFFTPEDFRSELKSPQGSAFSVEPTLTQSAYFRPHNRDPKVSGLYLVGAGTHPGAGIPGVVNSAKATSGIIINDLREGRVGARDD
jgi:phytoene desaturase